MGNRREIRPDWTLYCKRGDHWVHIDNFYRGPGVWVNLTYTTAEGEEVNCPYGKPMSYCAECSRSYQKDRREGTHTVAPKTYTVEVKAPKTAEELEKEREDALWREAYKFAAERSGTSPVEL